MQKIILTVEEGKKARTQLEKEIKQKCAYAKEINQKCADGNRTCAVQSQESVPKEFRS